MFCSAIARSNETMPRRLRQPQRERVGAALDGSRQPAREDPKRQRHDAAARASAGSAPALALAGDIPQLSRCTANAAAGAVSAANATLRGTSRWRTWASVRDDHLDLVAVETVEQRVEQHHPLRRTKPGHVRVGGVVRRLASTE